MSDAAQMFALFGNGKVEIRAIPRGRGALTVSYADNAEDFAHQVALLDQRSFAGIYMTLNPLVAGFQPREHHAVCADDVARIRHILFDLDPKRDHPRGGKVCANDAEHAAALAHAKKLREHLKAAGFPEQMEMDSGSGAYLISACDLPNARDSVKLIERVLIAAARHDTPEVHVDQSVFDPPRVVRIAGSTNKKSAPTKERPNRPVLILSARDVLEPVSLEVLNAFAGTAIVPSEEPELKEVSLDALDAGELREKMELLTAYCKAKGNPPCGFHRNEQRHCYVISLSVCPIQGRHHTSGPAGILVYDSGAIGFHCFGEKCIHKKWPDVQKAMGSFAEFIKEHLAGPELQFDDPLRLARKHITRWSMPDGTPTVAHFLGSSWRYSRQEGWVELRNNELIPWVRDTIQREHIRLATFLTKLEADEEGEKKASVKPEPVYVEIVANTWRAIESECKHEVPVTASSPFWLVKHEWDAGDILPFNNGILNVKRVVEGRQDFFLPPTPKLFYEWHAPFDFDPQASHPVEWHKFLDSLGQDKDWIGSLQEIMGYTLWRNFDLQNFFTVVGPPRSGKNTLMKVTENMGGGACGLTLDDLVDQFGLEQAVGKRLAVIPEIERGPIKHQSWQVVQRLKAITGGDKVTINRKNITNISMTLPLKIFGLGNKQAVLPDNSGALVGRLIPLKLTRSFLGKEDRTLAEKLKSEYPGIVLWCLEGLKRLWAAKQFTLCQSTRDELEELQSSCAPEQRFVEDCCLVDTTKAVQVPALYTIYCRWNEAEFPGKEPLTAEQFSTELKAVAPVVVRKRLSSGDDLAYKHFEIVKTDFDSTAERPYIWCGICPREECRKNAAK
ncbi:MAG: DUF5906 domain-containing protein [Thermoguttaceae bacterium]|jgi:putative DNA primase/helicase